MDERPGPGLRRRLFQLAWPLFIETALLLLIGTADTVMVARYSNDASGAVGVGNQVISIFNLLFMIVSVGSGILASQFIGARRKDQVAKITMMSLFLNVIVGTLSSLVLVAFAPVFLGWLGLEGDFLAYGTTYVQIVGGASVFQSAALSMSAVIRSHGHTKIAMKASLTANLVNVFLNFVLIYGVDFLRLPALGVAGAAIATFVSRLVNLGMLSWALFKNVDPSLSLSLLRPFPKDLFRKMLKIGLPGTGENISYNASQLVITGFVTTIGTLALNTKTFFSTVVTFVYAFCLAIANANAILAGQFTGQERYEDSHRLTLFGLGVSEVISLTVLTLIAVFLRPLMGIFTDNPDIIALAGTIIWIDYALEIGRTANIHIGMALKASGDVIFPVTMAAIVSWTLVIPLAWFLGIRLGLGLPGIWIAISADEAVRGVILLLRWLSGRWRNRSLVKNA